MIGNRMYRVGLRIEGNLRYGGTRKQDAYLKYTTVCITNENYTSQTYAYCFNKLIHAKLRTTKQSKVNYREIKGFFICYNCCNTSLRNKLSALAIVIPIDTPYFFKNYQSP